MADQTSSSPFLEIPGELRNRIYRFAITEDTVDVGLDGFPEPGLLMTCKSLRKEAGPIFYSETIFVLDITNFDSKVPCEWTKKTASARAEFRLKPGIVSTDFSPCFPPNWNNLSSWLQAYHSQRMNVPLVAGPEAGATDLIVSAMFMVVKAMRDKSWREVSEILGEQQKALALIDPRWQL